MQTITDVGTYSCQDFPLEGFPLIHPAANQVSGTKKSIELEKLQTHFMAIHPIVMKTFHSNRKCQLCGETGGQDWGGSQIS